MYIYIYISIRVYISIYIYPDAHAECGTCARMGEKPCTGKTRCAHAGKSILCPQKKPTYCVTI